MPALMNLIQPLAYEMVVFPTKEAFDQIEKGRKVLGHVRPGQVVVFTCGPISRILAQEGCRIQPEATWLDIGSAYDPLTRGVWHRCHTGKLPTCPGCNR